MEMCGGKEVIMDIHMKIDANHIYWEVYQAECSIHDTVHIGPFTSIMIKAGLVMEEGSTMGPSVTIVDHDHNLENTKSIMDVGKKEPIHIGKRCWIGANVTILKGVTLEDDCVVGAGSVVLRGVYKKGSVLVGNPAKVKWMRGNV